MKQSLGLKENFMNDLSQYPIRTLQEIEERRKNMPILAKWLSTPSDRHLNEDIRKELEKRKDKS